MRGAAGSHLKAITLKDLERRYGYFLDHLQRRDTLDASGAAGVLVTQQNVQSYLEDMFRTAAATSASLYDGVNLRLGSAVLNHSDQHTTEQHYRIASSHQAGNTLRSAIRKLI